MRPELDHLPLPDWFWHGETLLPIIERHRPMVCVELGTNRGCSAIATARLLQRWQGHLTCIDTWEQGNYGASITAEACQRNVNAAGMNGYITLCQMRIEDAARMAADNAVALDYLYIDADHTFDSVTRDLELWWPFLKVGGLIAGDDYDDPADTQVPPNVTRAWDTFEAKYGQAFERTPTPGLGSRLIWGVKQ